MIIWYLTAIILLVEVIILTIIYGIRTVYIEWKNKKYEKEEEERRIREEQESREFWRTWRINHPEWQDWDTSTITDMSKMFSRCKMFGDE